MKNSHTRKNVRSTKSREELFNFIANNPCREIKDSYGNYFCVKKDSIGFIISPLDTNLNAGWGKTAQECYEHFKRRNRL